MNEKNDELPKPKLRLLPINVGGIDAECSIKVLEFNKKHPAVRIEISGGETVWLMRGDVLNLRMSFPEKDIL